MIPLTTKGHNLFAYILFTDLRKTHLDECLSKRLCICANIWRWVNCFSPSYYISCCVFLLKYTSNYVGGLHSYRYGLLWWLFGYCTTCLNNEGELYYYLSFVCCPIVRLSDFSSNAKAICPAKSLSIQKLKDNCGGRRLLCPPNPHQSQVPPNA